MSMIIIFISLTVAMTMNDTMATPVNDRLNRVENSLTRDREFFSASLKDETQARINLAKDLETERHNLKTEKQARSNLTRTLETERQARIQLQTSVDHLTTAMSSEFFSRSWTGRESH